MTLAPRGGALTSSSISRALPSHAGLYFIDALLDAALASPAQAKFIVADDLNALRSFGGVRLEDVVAVTGTGIVNYTLCPRTCDEVESVMAGGAWPPATDEAKWLCRAWYAVHVDT